MAGKVSPASLFDPSLKALGTALDLRLRQHGLVSSNVANADVPGFRAKRLDFGAAFAQAMEEGAPGGPDTLRRTHASHAAGEPGRGAELPIVELEAPAWSEDGNSVNAEEEMVVLVENNLLYNATTEVLGRKLALLEYAASDGGK
jgi:flagellar basal-body rod protein FlgB